MVKKYTVFIILMVGVGLSLYGVSFFNEHDKIDMHRIEQIAERLESIESQLKSLQSANVSMTDVAGKIDDIQYDLKNVKNTIPELGKIEKLVDRLESRGEGDPALSPEFGDDSSLQQDIPTAVEEEVEAEAEPTYHVVKKGENLYRISLNYHLKIDYLRQVNGLGTDNQIYPGQILLVK
ncbi:LysM peptidoglycan-binding domain-containing protein [Desulfoprunum benzoelyticum]|uniref:LysM repeat protein n=1 Tax=Desulfoprunum benzoelyticum TaxID=1506996 RepID=A0A840V0L8_9BACT|nr:LysM domain-containing protein [Desulfoprunum benzoelyticum]MBB5349224.1 LysM repeat protein [Desulfoprunum benzoelyticum]MBM9530845.1 LysM peptidoglycan-binding domain-containing protein [Desulfoprunum benzoelyticum]